METLAEFVGRLRKSIGCYYHLCKSEYFSLKKVNTGIKGRMGVFAYVLEKKRNGLFRVDISDHIAHRAGVKKLACEEKPKLMWGRPGVCFFVRKGSASEDYQKAVKALRAVLLLR